MDPKQRQSPGNGADHTNGATGDDSPVGEGSNAPLKRRRITRACDRCHRSGIKCSSSSNPLVCGPCAAYGSPCTYDRPVKRRGPPPARQRSGLDLKPYSSSSHDGEGADEAWVYHEVASPSYIEKLAEAYYRIIYPIQPYFHWPTFMSDIRSQRYTHDRPFFACVMAMCALISARLRDGASLAYADCAKMTQNGPRSEDFYKAACGSFPRDLCTATDFDYKRAKTHLALLCIQYGETRQLQVHLGDYTTLVAMDGFHNEARWPVDLTEIERQEWRRLFWSTYQLDVYSSITWGGTIRHRESEATVLYPAEVYDDEDISATEINLMPHEFGTVSWLKGWNFTTDLYRILEHAIERVRMRRHVQDPDPGGVVSCLFQSKAGPSSAEISGAVAKMYEDLPSEFRAAKAMSGDPKRDRLGFQATNIMVTMQTLKMVLAGTEDSSVGQRCGIAGELLDALTTVPTAYIQAINAPTLHHLAGVGHLLGSVIQSPLSQWQYLQVRNVLLAMADVIAGLESALSMAAGIAPRLRAHVARIDRYMAEAAMERARDAKVYHNLPTENWGGGGAPVQTGKRIPDSSSNYVVKSEPSPSAPLQGATAPAPAPAPASASALAPAPAPAPAPAQSASLPRPISTAPDFNMPNFSPRQIFQPATSAQASANALAVAAGIGEGQVLLPDDIFSDWPFDFGQGEAFDFMGDLNTGAGPAFDFGTPATTTGMTGMTGTTGTTGMTGTMTGQSVMHPSGVAVQGQGQQLATTMGGLGAVLQQPGQHGGRSQM